jgi:formylglycine-generating enzyme required for sulfatase activity
MKPTAILSYTKMPVENGSFRTALDQQGQQQANWQKKGKKNKSKHNIQQSLTHPVRPGMTK